MDPRLKQRLVGAVILVALAVIFVPMLLQPPERMEPVERRADPPPQPELEAPVEAPEAGVPEAGPGERDGPLVPEIVGDGPADALDAPARPLAERAEGEEGRDDAEEPTTWAVQVGSFGSRDGALEVRERLRARGFSAYVERLEGEDGVLYRVRVGPVIERQEAESLQAELEAEADLEGWVVRHP